MKIGILGGSFNPIHKGHIYAAKYTLRNLKLDEIWFIPAFLPPHKAKSLFISSYHRFAMLSLALQYYPKFKALTLEIETNQICYTIDTIYEIMNLINKNDDIYFITGDDAFSEIQTWKNYQLLLTLVYFVVLQRDKEKGKLLFSLPDFIKKRYIVAPEELSLEKNKNILLLEGKMPNISSSKIRELIKKGEAVNNYLAKPVLNYIKKNNLYQ